jgi:hypothetical protein
MGKGLAAFELCGVDARSNSRTRALRFGKRRPRASGGPHGRPWEKAGAAVGATALTTQPASRGHTFAGATKAMTAANIGLRTRYSAGDITLRIKENSATLTRGRYLSRGRRSTECSSS